MRKLPFLLVAIEARHPAKDASIYNTIYGLGLRIGVKKPIILLFHQYTFALESIINLSKFPSLIFIVLFLFISKDL